jgi:hypothetical protein
MADTIGLRRRRPRTRPASFRALANHRRLGAGKRRCFKILQSHSTTPSQSRFPLRKYLACSSAAERDLGRRHKRCGQRRVALGLGGGGREVCMLWPGKRPPAGWRRRTCHLSPTHLAQQKFCSSCASQNGGRKGTIFSVAQFEDVRAQEQPLLFLVRCAFVARRGRLVEWSSRVPESFSRVRLPRGRLSARDGLLTSSSIRCDEACSTLGLPPV